MSCFLQGLLLVCEVIELWHQEKTNKCFSTCSDVKTLL